MTRIKRDKTLERGYQQNAGTPAALAALAALRGDQHPEGDYIQLPETRGKTFRAELVEELADATMYIMYEKQLLIADCSEDQRAYDDLTTAHFLIAQAATILGIGDD